MKPWILLCILALCAGLSACEGDKEYASNDAINCGDGDDFSFNGEDFCLYKGAIIEEGFQCPPELARIHDFGDFIACAQGDLPAGFEDSVRERTDYQDAGGNIESQRNRAYYYHCEEGVEPSVTNLSNSSKTPFSGDGDFVFGIADQKGVIFDVATGDRVWEQQLETQFPLRVVHKKTGQNQFIALQDVDGQSLNLWFVNLEGDRVEEVLVGQLPIVFNLSISSTDEWFVISGQRFDGEGAALIRWDDMFVFDMTPYLSQERDVVAAFSGDVFLMGALDQVVVFDLASDPILVTRINYEGEIYDLKISPAGDMIYAQSFAQQGPTGAVFKITGSNVTTVAQGEGLKVDRDFRFAAWIDATDERDNIVVLDLEHDTEAVFYNEDEKYQVSGLEMVFDGLGNLYFVSDDALDDSDFVTLSRINVSDMTIEKVAYGLESSYKIDCAGNSSIYCNATTGNAYYQRTFFYDFESQGFVDLNQGICNPFFVNPQTSSVVFSSYMGNQECRLHLFADGVLTELPFRHNLEHQLGPNQDQRLVLSRDNKYIISLVNENVLSRYELRPKMLYVQSGVEVDLYIPNGGGVSSLDSYMNSWFFRYHDGVKTGICFGQWR